MTQVERTLSPEIIQGALEDHIWAWEQRLKRTLGFVYLIDCPEVNATKVGFSKNPRDRLSHVQVHCPLRLVLRSFYPADDRHELALHSALSEWKVRGEWFETGAVDRLFADLDSIKGERERDISTMEAFEVWVYRFTEAYPGCGYVEPLW